MFNIGTLPPSTIPPLGTANPPKDMDSESGPKISITELTNEHVKFILYNCDLRYKQKETILNIVFNDFYHFSFANSLRRIMIAEVPTISK